jgi:RNA polymerase sigma-70 factor, ECF subfamily
VLRLGDKGPVERDAEVNKRPPVTPRPEEPGAPPELASWMEAMRPRLIRLARQFLWNEQDVEEIVQEAMFLGWQKASRLRDPARRNTWLYRITINLSMNRRRQRWPAPLGDPQPGADVETDETKQERDELVERIRIVLGELPNRQQAALVLREIEGMDYDQIAAILQTRQGAVRLLVHRGREAIRQMLLKRWPDTFGK